MIRVVIADEADLMLAGACSVIAQQGHYEVVGTYPSLPSLLDGLRSSAPDVILLSDRLEPDLDVLALVERVRRAAPQARLVILSFRAAGLVVRALFNAGVSGYLYKGDPLSEDILIALRTVMRGRLFLSPTVSAEYLLLAQSGQADWQLDDEALDVLHRLAGGLRSQEIALTRGVLVRRIYRVTERLRYRFGAETNEHLIARAAEEGFLP